MTLIQVTATEYALICLALIAVIVPTGMLYMWSVEKFADFTLKMFRKHKKKTDDVEKQIEDTVNKDEDDRREQ